MVDTIFTCIHVDRTKYRCCRSKLPCLVAPSSRYTNTHTSQLFDRTCKVPVSCAIAACFLSFYTGHACADRLRNANWHWMALPKGLNWRKCANIKSTTQYTWPNCLARNDRSSRGDRYGWSRLTRITKKKKRREKHQTNKYRFGFIRSESEQK